MTPTMMRRCFGAVALTGALAIVAACSGPSGSGSLTSTGPSGGAGLAGGGVTFNPFPEEPDPCEPATTTGLSTNPSEPEGCGRFTGGGFQIGEVKVTRGFTLHCDALLSNNFEVNWPDGNNFHIDKNPTDVTCQFISDPNPPDAPVNRIDITGPGTLNGAPATVTLVLVDNGEKVGAPADQAYIAINGSAITGGSIAAPAPLDGGNIQAHEDQPHK